MIRLRLLRHLFTKGPLPIPVHSICMDAYGALLDRGASALHHEQHLRRHDLVLPASDVGHHKRHLRLHLWNYVWQNAAYQAESEEDR